MPNRKTLQLLLRYLKNHKTRLNPFFIKNIDYAPHKPVRLIYESGSALCVIAVQTSSFLFNEHHTTTRYFSKTVASCSPVRLIVEKISKQFIGSVFYNPVRLIVRKARYYRNYLAPIKLKRSKTYLNVII